MSDASEHPRPEAHPAAKWQDVGQASRWQPSASFLGKPFGKSVQTFQANLLHELLTDLSVAFLTSRRSRAELKFSSP